MRLELWHIYRGSLLKGSFETFMLICFVSFYGKGTSIIKFPSLLSTCENEKCGQLLY